jgi:hypothetical protein
VCRVNVINFIKRLERSRQDRIFRRLGHIRGEQKRNGRQKRNGGHRGVRIERLDEVLAIFVGIIATDEVVREYPPIPLGLEYTCEE